jgi:hypothetical protein
LLIVSVDIQLGSADATALNVMRANGSVTLRDFEIQPGSADGLQNFQKGRFTMQHPTTQ